MQNVATKIGLEGTIYAADVELDTLYQAIDVLSVIMFQTKEVLRN